MDKIKYVDLNGLKYFAEELKRYLESHMMEYSIYEELLERIQNVEIGIEDYTFYKVIESYDKLLELTPQKNIIYLVPDNGNFLEYIWTDNGYEQLGSFTPELKLDDYLKKDDSLFEKGSDNSVILKGEAIKESSIPLSALSSDMNIPSVDEFVKKLSTEDVNTSLELLYTDTAVLVSNYRTVIRIIKGGESTTYNNYGMTFTISAIQQDSTLLLNISGQGSISAFDIHVYKKINKLNKAFLPDDIGGADWNAQPGEAGYIKNRTHYLDGKFSDTLGKGVTKMPYVYAKAAYFDNTIIEIPPFEEGLEVCINSGPPIYIKYIYEDDNQIIELIDNYSYFENKVIEFYHNIRSIEPAYIPDTVLKTTPQSLSNDNKNQALANLGIDLNLLMYSMNPIVMTFSQRIPEELWDTNANRLRGEESVSQQNYRVYAPIKVFETTSGTISDFYYNNEGYYVNNGSLLVPVYIVNGILSYNQGGGS